MVFANFTAFQIFRQKHTIERDRSIFVLLFCRSVIPAAFFLTIERPESIIVYGLMIRLTGRLPALCRARSQEALIEAAHSSSTVAPYPV